MTLVELLIVVVITGVLASFAYPGYTSHILKAHRTQAIADMVKLQLELEKTYTPASGYNTALDPAPLCDSAADRYRFTISATDTYTITATPQSQQAGDPCGTLTLNASGSGTPAECW